MDYDLLYVQDPGETDVADPMDARSCPLERESPQRNDGAGGRVDDDGRGGAGQDVPDLLFALDGYCLGNGHGAEAARIQTVDVAAGGGLRD